MFVWDRAGAHPALRSGRAARPGAAQRHSCRSCSPASRSPPRTTAARSSLRRVVSSKEVIDRAVERRCRLRREEGRRRPTAAGADRPQQSGVAARAVRRSEPQRADRSWAPTFALHGFKRRPLVQPLRRHAAVCRAAVGQGRQAGLQRLPESVPLRLEGRHRPASSVRCRTQGLFQSLAEPNLVAESGKEASFLAGGEIPIPIAQPSSGTRRDSRCSTRSSASA